MDLKTRKKNVLLVTSNTYCCKQVYFDEKASINSSDFGRKKHQASVANSRRKNKRNNITVSSSGYDEIELKVGLVFMRAVRHLYECQLILI